MSDPNCVNDLQAKIHFDLVASITNMVRKRKSMSTRHGEHFIDLSIIR